MKKRPNSWLVFFSLGLQIGLVMYFAIQLGSYFDTKIESEKPWATLVMAIIAMVAILRLIVNQTKKM